MGILLVSRTHIEGVWREAMGSLLVSRFGVEVVDGIGEEAMGSLSVSRRCVEDADGIKVPPSWTSVTGDVALRIVCHDCLLCVVEVVGGNS